MGAGVKLKGYCLSRPDTSSRSAGQELAAALAFKLKSCSMTWAESLLAQTVVTSSSLGCCPNVSDTSFGVSSRTGLSLVWKGCVPGAGGLEGVRSEVAATSSN